MTDTDAQRLLRAITGGGRVRVQYDAAVSGILADERRIILAEEQSADRSQRPQPSAAFSRTSKKPSLNPRGFRKLC
ncbi:MAG: hypothetical protein ACLU3I_14955 [Acutalibacteraceae bacterium]